MTFGAILDRIICELAKLCGTQFVTSWTFENQRVLEKNKESAWKETKFKNLVKIDAIKMLQRWSFSANKTVWLELFFKRKTSKDTLRVLNWLSWACRRKLHKRILVFKYLNNLVKKYLTQCFTRNMAFYDHLTWRSIELHTPKPKHSVGKRTFKTAGTICFNALPACLKSAPF